MHSGALIKGVILVLDVCSCFDDSQLVIVEVFCSNVKVGLLQLCVCVLGGAK